MSESYVLHSMVRKVQTRIRRVLAPKRHKFVQRLGGGEVTLRRGRPVTVTKVLFDKLLPEIKQRHADGMLEVRTPTGQLVDLSTMEVAAPPKKKKQAEPVKAAEKLLEAPPLLDDVPPPAIADDGVPEGEEAEEMEETSEYKPSKKTSRKKRGSRK